MYNIFVIVQLLNGKINILFNGYSFFNQYRIEYRISAIWHKYGYLTISLSAILRSLKMKERVTDYSSFPEFVGRRCFTFNGYCVNVVQVIKNKSQLVMYKLTGFIDGTRSGT
ncbi:MAG TPA: hypothetical protein DDW85_01420 [Porphyromonadaceae bacterium]|nr:hypothetical protein [Porphyromonadaceae bacterium]